MEISEIGKYFWVDNDFNYTGESPIKVGLGTAKITDIKIDENFIEFTVIKPESEITWFRVKLIRQHGTVYSDGESSAELFCNEKNFLIFAKSVDNGFHFTWWAKVDRIK